MKKAPYRAGDWFAIPLEDGTFAPGRVVLHVPPQGVLGYLFAPQHGVPDLQGVARLEPGDALAAIDMSGLHIGDPWPLLGGSDGFDPTGWKIPEFESDLRQHFPAGKEVRISLIDSHLRSIHSCQAPLSELGKRQEGGAFGAEAVELWLGRRLAEGSLVPLRTQPWWDNPTTC